MCAHDFSLVQDESFVGDFVGSPVHWEVGIFPDFPCCMSTDMSTGPFFASKFPLSELEW